LFKEIDKNGDGTLSKEELYEGSVKIFGEQLTMVQINAIFEKADIDGSGSIDYEEFLVACVDKNQALSEKNLKDAFNLLDTQKKGYLSVDEMKVLFSDNKLLKESQLIKIIKEGDKNGDGMISFEEFRDMMKNA